VEVAPENSLPSLNGEVQVDASYENRVMIASSYDVLLAKLGICYGHGILIGIQWGFQWDFMGFHWDFTEFQ
jgi:hypothetical protein